PDYPLPPGQTPMGFLRALCERGAKDRYGAGPLALKARHQIEHELELIGRLDLPGYFLIVWDLIEYCRRHDILVQGRGSAANSAVCYALGITAVDPVGMKLLFERFLSEERGEWPDIDLDLPSGDRREQVIQYLPRHLGQHSGGMVVCAGRLDGVVPLEPASMPDRSVVQWDKDDCAAMGIIKVDLLGLGMMALLEDALEMIRRRGGHVDLAHLPTDPAVYAMLKRTLGVPLFQEQLLRMAMAAAGFTGGEAEELRRAFGFKRRKQAMDEVEKKLRAGMASKGITGEAAEAILRSITSFALYGFPESHAASFALLAYASAYLKTHHPAAFYAALLNNQPMGFYHPATIVGDAARHGQVIRPLDVNHSDWLCIIEADGTVRLGLRYVRGLREEAGRHMERARPFASADDLVQRAGLRGDELPRPAELGALGSLGLERRAALWDV